MNTCKCLLEICLLFGGVFRGNCVVTLFSTVSFAHPLLAGVQFLHVLLCALIVAAIALIYVPLRNADPVGHLYVFCGEMSI